MRCLFLVTAIVLSLLAGPTFASLPPGVQVVPPYDPAGALFASPGADSAVMSIVTASDQPFARAIQIITKKTTPNPWDVQIVVPTSAEVKEGDTLSLTFYARVLTPHDGSAVITAGFERASGSYTKSLDFTLTPPGDWKRFDLPFKSLEAYAPGEAHLHILLGYLPQTVELGGLCVIDYGRQVDPLTLPRFLLTYAGREPDASWRKAAASRIEKYRKAAFLVKIVDQSGKPIPNAQVHFVEMRPAFFLGTAVSYWQLIPPGADNDIYRRQFSDLFTEGSPENELKYTAWYSHNPKDQQAADAVVDWEKAHHIGVRGHNLIWPSWNQSPPQLKADFAAHQLADGSDAARKWLSSTLTAHITEEVMAFKGRIPEWDVINEPVGNHDFMDMLGDGTMVVWLKAAHAADPAARLFINNDGTFYGQDSPADIAAFERTLRFLQSQGAPLGGIGLESHFGSSLSSPDQIVKSLDEYTKFGVPLEITEYDFKTSDKTLQADYTRDFLTVCFSEPSVKGFQMWGFWDGSHWLGDSAMFNKDWTLKPSGQAILDLMQHAWRTDASGLTSASGLYSGRGFLGEYTLTVSSQGRTKTVPVTLGKLGCHLTVTL